METEYEVSGPSSISLWDRVANPGASITVDDCASPGHPGFIRMSLVGPVPDERYFDMHMGTRDDKTKSAFADCLEVLLTDTARRMGVRCFRPKDDYRPDIELEPPRKQWLEVKLQRTRAQAPALNNEDYIRLGRYQFESYRKLQNRLPKMPIVYVVFLMETAELGWVAFNDLRIGVEVLPMGWAYCFPSKLFQWQSAGYDFCHRFREMIRLYEPQLVLPFGNPPVQLRLVK